MTRLFLINTFLYFLITLTSVYAVETRGLLESVENSSIIVGESYPFKLTLVPFEKSLLSADKLKGKNLFNLFYIVDVTGIKTSENNYDAVEVNLDLVMLKKAALRDVYIWNLEDRNIPIEISKLNINDVQLNTQKFLILDTPSVEFEKSNSMTMILCLLAMALLVAMAFFVKRKPRKTVDTRRELIELLTRASSHSDLEEIFKRRREIYLITANPSTQQEIREVISRFEKDQYSRNWRDSDVEDFLKKLSGLGKELQDGV